MSVVQQNMWDQGLSWYRPSWGVCMQVYQTMSQASVDGVYMFMMISRHVLLTLNQLHCLCCRFTSLTWRLLCCRWCHCFWERRNDAEHASLSSKFEYKRWRMVEWIVLPCFCEPVDTPSAWWWHIHWSEDSGSQNTEGMMCLWIDSAQRSESFTRSVASTGSLIFFHTREHGIERRHQCNLKTWIWRNQRWWMASLEQIFSGALQAHKRDGSYAQRYHISCWGIVHEIDRVSCHYCGHVLEPNSHSSKLTQHHSLEHLNVASAQVVFPTHRSLWRGELRISHGWHFRKQSKSCIFGTRGSRDAWQEPNNAKCPRQSRFL